jgi:hypothetical protein
MFSETLNGKLSVTNRLAIIWTKQSSKRAKRTIKQGKRMIKRKQSTTM